jgi:hypothetical protein
MSRKLYGKAALFKGPAAGAARGPAGRKAERQPGDKATGQQVSKSTSQHGATADVGDFKRFTYYLRPETGRALKVQAAEQGRDLSELVREVLEGHLARRKG